MNAITARNRPVDARRRTELRIHKEGHAYRFLGYRYDRLEDAIAYARLVKARASQHLAEDRATPGFVGHAEHPPGVADVPVMASLGVSYYAGHYFCEGFRYDRLADALAYARRQHRS